MTIQSRTERLDDAARAGWLYYIAGNTQDDIAKALGVSRQKAQRLVSLALSEGLIKFRLDHPIARCMTLARELRQKFALDVCEIVPSDPADQFASYGVAQAAAVQVEKVLQSKTPKTLAFGTGRALRACVQALEPQHCPQHVLVSLLGNIMLDGSATAYDVIIRLAEKVGSRHFPMPIPPVARSVEERDMYIQQEPVANIHRIASQADATFVGIGEMTDKCPMHIDGFINREELRALLDAGIVGEITSWCYDADGQIYDGLVNDRVTNVPLIVGGSNLVCGIAAGKNKVASISSALKGKLINGLVTNEATADRVLRG